MLHSHAHAPNPGRTPIVTLACGRQLAVQMPECIVLCRVAPVSRDNLWETDNVMHSETEGWGEGEGDEGEREVRVRVGGEIQHYELHPWSPRNQLASNMC